MDFRITDDFADHFKLERLVGRLGEGSVRCLLRVFGFASRNRPSGFLDGLTIDDIETIARWSARRKGQFVTALVELNWLELHEARYSIHNWNVRQPFLTDHEQRSARATKAARTRWNRHADASESNAKSVRGASAEHAPSMQAASTSSARSNALFDPDLIDPKRSDPDRSRKNIAYTPEFESANSIYPKRAGSNPKPPAFKAWKSLLKDGTNPSELIAAVERYAAHCRDEGIVGTKFVMQAARFFGPNEEWKQDWKTSSARNGKETPIEMAARRHQDAKEEESRNGTIKSNGNNHDAGGGISELETNRADARTV